jgi:uncharacterized protein (TIGR02466 family)
MIQAKKQIVPLFPTYLWKIEFPDELTQSINRSILPLIERKLKNAPITPEKILQTEQNLHLEPEFEELAKYIYLYANSALQYLNFEFESIQITGCWANISGMGNTHRRHSHPNNFLSGVYYVEAPPGNNNIMFHDPRTQTDTIKPPVKKMTFENTDHMIAEVIPGTMLLFPAWLHHSVPTNQGGNRRVSVAFNLMFQQFAETMGSPMWKKNIY